MDKTPLYIKTSKGYAIMHESGIYFLDETENLAESLKNISLKSRSSLSSISKKEKLAKVIIYLSSSCNLRCIYCYANAGEHKSIVSIDNAKALIDFVSQKVDRIILDFHGGGEPLLFFDIIKDLYEYAKATGKLYRTVLISNGVIEAKKEYILDWITEKVDVMALSCDGIPEIQNKQRPHHNGIDSSNEIEETIRFFNKKNYTYTVRSTITKESSVKMLEITKYFYELGVKYLVFSPCYNYGRSDDIGLVPDAKTYGDNYMAALEFAVNHGIRLTSNSFRYPGYHYCGSLSGFNIALTTDNYISSCYEVVSNTDPVSEKFIVGKIENGNVILFKDRINGLHEIEDDHRCDNCQYKLVCRGSCPVKRIRNSISSLNSQCRITKYLVPKILDYIHNNPTSAPLILKNVTVADY